MDLGDDPGGKGKCEARKGGQEVLPENLAIKEQMIVQIMGFPLCKDFSETVQTISQGAAPIHEAGGLAGVHLSHLYRKLSVTRKALLGEIQ